MDPKISTKNIIDFLTIFHTYIIEILSFLSLFLRMTTDLKKFEQNRKTNIANTIGSGLWLGVEELSRAVSGAKKTTTT